MSLVEDALVVAKNLERFGDENRMGIGVAQRLVKDSAWWHGHPHGPTHAPKHYERVMLGAHGWEIEFGANTFLVGQAILRCKRLIATALDLALASHEKVDEIELRKKLALAVRGAVATYNGDEYSNYYDVYDDFMLFGTQAIKVTDFVNAMCDLASIHLISMKGISAS